MRGSERRSSSTLVIRHTLSIISPPAIAPGSEWGCRSDDSAARGGSGLFVGSLPLERCRGTAATGRWIDCGNTHRIAGTYRFVARARDTEARSLRWPVLLVVAPKLAVGLSDCRRRSRSPYSANLTARECCTDGLEAQERRLTNGVRLVPTLGRFTGTRGQLARTGLRSKSKTDSTRCLLARS